MSRIGLPALRLLNCVLGLVLCGVVSAVPVAGQVATFTQWDLPTTAGVGPGALFTDKSGSVASPLGTVWYVTRGDPRLIRLMPADPPESGPASWTAWNLGPTELTGGLKLSLDGVAFVRTTTDLQRIDANTNLHTRWTDGQGSVSDLALDGVGGVWTASGGRIQLLVPSGAGDATVTLWPVGGFAGGVYLSGIAFNSASGLVYYSGPVDVSIGNPTTGHIGELDPSTGTVRRWSLRSVGGIQPRQLALDANGDVWVVTANDKIIRLSVAANQLTAFRVPRPRANPLGISACSLPIIGFAESNFGAPKIGVLTPAGAPVNVIPTTSTVTPTTTTITATPLLETPLTGTVAPVISTTPVTTSPAGDFMEAPLPLRSFFPLGIDCNPLGTVAASYYFAVGHAGVGNRVARIEVQ